MEEECRKDTAMKKKKKKEGTVVKDSRAMGRVAEPEPPFLARAGSGSGKSPIKVFS